MTILRLAARIVALTFILAPLGNAQEAQRTNGDAVRVTTARDKVHVAIGGDLYETRVEVASADGEIVFESGILSGNAFDWEMSNSLGARVAPGDYTLTITYRTPTGKLMRRTEQVSVPESGQKAQTSEAGPSPTAVGTITGEGAAGKIAKFDGTNSITSSAILTESAGKLLLNGALEVGAASGVGVNPTIVNPKNIANFALVRFYPAAGTNVNTSFTVVPRGTGQPNNRAQFSITNTDAIADPSNVEFAALRARGSDFVFGTGKSGTGQIRPLMFSAGYMTDNATNANQLYLATDGNVGIGTTPAAGFKLDVSGVARINPTGVSGGGLIQFYTPNVETGMSIKYPGTGRADLRFDGQTIKLTAGPDSGPPAATNGIVIRKEGAVGIGVENPNLGKLQVVNPSSTAIHASSSTGTAIAGTSSTGFAFASAGNAIQSLDKGGWVKAMIEYDSEGNAIRCYNSQTGSSTPPCDFIQLGRPGEQGSPDFYHIIAPFTVEGRFVSITSMRAAGGVPTGVNYEVDGIFIEVYTFVSSTGAPQRTGFTIIIY